MTGGIVRLRAAVLMAAATLTLGAAGCTGDTPTTAARTPSAASTPSAAGTPSTAGAPSATGAASGRPEPSGGASPGRSDATAEAADKFGIPRARLDQALTAVRVRMVQVGGPTGADLAGTDPQPKPLDQGAHLDPSMIRLFATRLGIPIDRARTVMEFLLGEWNEYDTDAERQNPGTYQRIVRYMAPQLKISQARAAWLESLLISRPAAGANDPIFTAVAAAVHVTPDRLGVIVDAMKSQPR